MKELSIEEKAKRYDEVVDRLRYAFNSNRCTLGFMNEILRYPRESKDERIRKELIDFFQDWHKTKPSRLGVNVSDILAWLEKQGKNEEINEASYRAGIKRVLDNPESYGLEKQGEQKLPIEKLPEEMKSIGESLGFTTQEECDKYNKMVSDLIMSDNDKGEQKPAEWSKEDEKIREAICYVLNHSASGLIDNTNFTVSQMEDWLGKQMQPKQEWRKNEKQMFADIITIVGKSNAYIREYQRELVDFLKSLKERYTWKPSDEQMEALYEETQKSDRIRDDRIVSLYNDLNKLKGE